MRHLRSTKVVVCAAIASAVLLGGVSAASASDASIKAAVKSYTSKILVAEGHVVTAIGRYKETGEPVQVEDALTKSAAVLQELKSKIASQSASSTKVKAGKAKLEKGLTTVMLAYQRLKKAFGEKKVSKQAAKTEATKALVAIRQGRQEIREAAVLLK